MVEALSDGRLFHDRLIWSVGSCPAKGGQTSGVERLNSTSSDRRDRIATGNSGTAGGTLKTPRTFLLLVSVRGMSYCAASRQSYALSISPAP